MKLRDYLKREKMTIVEFAQITHLSRVCIYNLINGTKRPLRSTAYIIEHATKGAVTLEDLIYVRSKNPKRVAPKHKEE